MALSALHLHHQEAQVLSSIIATEDGVSYHALVDDVESLRLVRECRELTVTISITSPC